MLKFFTAQNAKKAAAGAAYGSTYLGLCYVTSEKQVEQTKALKAANPGHDVEWKFQYVPGVGGYWKPSLVKPGETPTAPTPQL